MNNNKIIYKITQDDVELKATSQVLANSFFNYPTTNYLFPDISARTKFLAKFYYYLIHQTTSVGRVLVALDGDTVVGTASYVKVAHSDQSLLQTVTSKLIFIPLLMPFITTLRSLKISNYLSQKRHELASANDLYITFVAVDPKYQGRGISRNLINYILNDLEFKNCNYFLETHKIENVTLYKHLGFKVLLQETYPVGAPESHFMIKNTTA